jgi:LEA14-like dessication related protein
VKKYFWIAFFGTLLLSCRSMKDPDFKGIENVRPGGLGLKNSTILMDLHYFNPNNSRLKLKRAEGDAWLENISLGHFTLDTLIEIPAHNDFWLPVSMEVDMKHVLQNTAILVLKTEVTVKVEGNARIGKAGLYINYPIHYEGKQNTAELIKIMKQ